MGEIERIHSILHSVFGPRGPDKVDRERKPRRDRHDREPDEDRYEPSSESPPADVDPSEPQPAKLPESGRLDLEA